MIWGFSSLQADIHLTHRNKAQIMWGNRNTLKVMIKTCLVPATLGKKHNNAVGTLYKCSSE